MTYKPADFFVGIVDAFGVLAPGAVLAFAATPLQNWVFGSGSLFPELPAGPQRWVAFLVVSYVAGYLLWVVASAAFDGLYDRYYSKARRLPKAQRSRLPWKRLWRAVHLQPAAFDDPLYAAALEVRAKHLAQLDLATKTKLEGESTYSWAQSVLTLNSASATADIERIQASSKFFRSFALTLLIVLLMWPLGDRVSTAYLETFVRHGVLAGLVAIAAVLIALLYMRLRWDATQRTYEYYVAWYLESRPRP